MNLLIELSFIGGIVSIIVIGGLFYARSENKKQKEMSE